MLPSILICDKFSQYHYFWTHRAIGFPKLNFYYSRKSVIYHTHFLFRMTLASFTDKKIISACVEKTRIHINANVAGCSFFLRIKQFALHFFCFLISIRNIALPFGLWTLFRVFIKIFHLRRILLKVSFDSPKFVVVN